MKAQQNLTVFTMSFKSNSTAITEKLSTMIKCMQLQTSFLKRDYQSNQKVLKLLILKNMELNTQLLSRNLTVQLYTSHVTWLRPSTVKMSINLPNLSMSLVKSNQLTLSNSRLSCKKWVTIGAKTLSMFRLAWLQKKGKNFLLVKGMLSCQNQLLQKPSAVLKRRSKPKILNLKTKTRSLMLLGLGPLNSMTLKLTVQMDMTLTLKLWYPSKGRPALMFNMPTLVSNQSCVKPISNLKQVPTIA